MADKSGSKKKQFIAFALSSIVAMAVCFGVLVATVNSLENNKTSVVDYDTESLTKLKNTKKQLSDYMKNITYKTQNNQFVKVNTYRDVFVDDGSVVVCDDNGEENHADKSILLYAKNKMMGTVDSYYGEDYVGVFGSVYEDMPYVDLTEKAISRASFSVGQADSEGNPIYDSDSGELIDGDSYYINFSINPKKCDEVEKLFNLDDRKRINKKLRSDLESVCGITDANTELTDLKITAKVNRITDNIEYIVFEKVYDIKAKIDFIGDYEVLGGKYISFKYTVQEKYEYFYAGISFSESAVTVKPDGETVLSVNAVIEDDSDYTVKFTSSDESVAVIDEMGYVKGIKESNKPVTITVTLKYLGETFKDTCVVNVGDTSSEGGVANE